MRRIALIALALLLAPAIRCGAQITHSSQGQLDRAASDILARAARKMSQNVAFRVEMRVLDGQHRELSRQEAQIRYNKGRYHLLHPDMELISDGTTVWQWDKAAQEVAVNNLEPGEAANLLNPSALLEGYERDFKAKYIRTDDDGTAVIDLQPRAARNYHKIRLLIDEESGLLKRLEVHKYDSGREIYTISDFRRATTPASDFTFDPAKHPGVEVIDMR